MGNQVQVDELDIDRQFEILEIEGEAADSQAEQALHDAVHEPESWLQGAKLAIDIVDAKVCPNWALDDSEKGELSGALAECLDRFFPGATAGIENWHPIAKLVFVGVGISVMRFDWDQGRMAPMHEIKDDKSDGTTDVTESGGRPADGSHGGESHGENGLSFAASKK